MTLFSCTFAFTESGSHVLLIRKARPDWQKGYLNGIGGKFEPSDRSMIDCTIREFREETGLFDLGGFEPRIFHAMLWPEYKTHTGWPLVYFSAGTISQGAMLEAVQNTAEKDEPCIIQPVDKLGQGNPVMGNLPFLIQMARYMVLCPESERAHRQPIVLRPQDYSALIADGIQSEAT